MTRWESEGPPLEAYSRVTNPERFRPLHGVALTLLEQLHASFNAERVEGYGLDSELESGALSRPSVRLIPDDPKAAPLTITFTTFPGLKVRVGRRCTAGFPACGCDACDETADAGLSYQALNRPRRRLHDVSSQSRTARASRDLH